MKRFQFTLEQILELRLEEEQEAEVRLGRDMGEWNKLHARREERLDVKKRYARGAGSADFLQQGLYLARIDQEIGKLGEQMKSMEPRLEQLRSEYREARAKREGLDKLKEKREEEHRQLRLKAEARSLDDLINTMNRQHI